MRAYSIVPVVVALAACGGEAKPKAEAAPPAPTVAPASGTTATKADSTKAATDTGKAPPAAKAAEGMLRDSAIKPIGAVDDKGKVTPLKRP